MQQRDPADRQDDEDFLGRVCHRGQRVAGEHWQRDLLGQQCVTEMLALHRAADEQPLGQSKEHGHDRHARPTRANPPEAHRQAGARVAVPRARRQASATGAFNGRHNRNLTAVRLDATKEVWVGAGALFIAVFLACAVEAVEATTIVLAAGTARDWRSANAGLLAAIVVLAVITAALGPAVSALPLQALRLFVGALLLVFGLQWLRKAILRASGHKALHDEDAIYREQISAARSEPARRTALVPDLYGFTLTFKGVLLEGLEVVFIALTFGSNAHQIPLAALAAVSAVVLVALAGVAIRAPLARVPENTMKFVVGVLLTSFGTFWGAEGAGATWPGSDAALLVLAPGIALFALALVAVARRVPAGPPRPGPTRPSLRPAEMAGQVAARVRAFGAFVYDFVIGDDWWVAAGVAAALVVTYLLAHAASVAAWWLIPAVVVLLLPVSLWRAIRKH